MSDTVTITMTRAEADRVSELLRQAVVDPKPKPREWRFKASDKLRPVAGEWISVRSPDGEILVGPALYDCACDVRLICTNGAQDSFLLKPEYSSESKLWDYATPEEIAKAKEVSMAHLCGSGITVHERKEEQPVNPIRLTKVRKGTYSYGDMRIIQSGSSRGGSGQEWRVYDTHGAEIDRARTLSVVRDRLARRQMEGVE